MKLRAQIALLLLCASAPILVGCSRNIVRAASPSVVTPPRPESPPDAGASGPAAESIPAPEIPQPAPALIPPPAAEPAPPPSRPAPVTTSAPELAQPGPAVAMPQITPVLTAADQERLTRLATDQIRIAERNLQTATGRRLNSLQDDLYQKVQGFLSQAHEAIRANDWVRAQNLAEKAQVLSSELVKSF
jgi:hypothetical protein